jgi:uncharacterized phage protein gp47/JayE
MPWQTPTLKQVRSLVRDAVQGSLPGADATIPNSVLRVVSDVMGALCHLVLQYIDWLADQLMPDTAESEWLDRHGQIWLVNADGSTGRKLATPAQGTVDFVASAANVFVPALTVLTYSNVASYETTEDLTTGLAGEPSPAPVIALTAGSAGNLDPGTALGFPTIANLASASVVVLAGGADTETDDELRARILERIRKPPMGGDADDYVEWALAYPGVTRAWCTTEMGIGTVSVRFMMDDLRAAYGGFPLPDDVAAVQAYLDTVRPVSVKDLFVSAPLPYPINLRIAYLDADTASVRGAITASLQNEFLIRSQPGLTWYRAWSDEGIMAAAGVNAYDLVADDVAMPSPGYMPVLGDLTYGATTSGGLRLG